MLTRLAPSPTGALHLGNARTFLINWALARRNGWRVLLRIEDLDGPRIKAGASEHAIETLRWLGLDWDEGPIYQSADPAPYRAALERLVDAGLAYPCRCTRSQILAASLSAPNQGDHELRYPGTCRPAAASGPDRLWEGAPDPDSGVRAEPAGTPESASGEASHTARAPKKLIEHLNDPGVSWRFVAPDEPVPFNDAFVGNQSFNPQQQVGDFLVATKDCQPSYQLAVVVDDARQGVTEVVRGDDLLSCTARQLLLYRALGLGPEPTYTHVPLVLGEDGHRLAKRHGDTRVSHYRDRGVAPERVLGLLGAWCGVENDGVLSLRELVDRFNLDRLATGPVTFTPGDDRWLLDGDG